MAVTVAIPELGEKFQDYRQGIPGDSFNWGPVINAQQVDTFTFHHSVTHQTAKNDGNWKKECDAIANLHLNRGWAGIGYRFVICSDGTVAYVGDLAHGGSGVANHNHHMFSAVMVGDFTKELPTAAQVHSAHLLAKHFLTQMPQYPNLARWDQVKGHKDFMATACPGANWPNDLRDRVINDHYDGYPDPQPITLPVPQPDPEPTPPVDCEKQVSGLKARNTDLSNQLGEAIAEVKNREEQVGRIKEQVLEEGKLRISLTRQLNQATQKVQEIAGLYEGQLRGKQEVIDKQGIQLGDKNKEIATLQTEVQRLKTNAIAAFSAGELFVLALKRLAGK